MRPDLPGTQGYNRNAWYVAGRSEEFGRDLTARRYLEEDVVIYRLEDGSPAALRCADTRWRTAGAFVDMDERRGRG